QLDGRRSRVATLAGRLDAMSPLRVLARGYALAFRASGALLLAADDAHPGERLHLELARGALDVQVVRRARSRRGADGEAPIDRGDGGRDERGRGRGSAYRESMGARRSPAARRGMSRPGCGRR